MNKKTGVHLILLAIFPVVISCGMYQEIQEMKKPRYEVGEHKGVKFCAECHEDIYNQWLTKSRHSVATTNKSFIEFRDKITDNFVLNALMGEAMCYACHGSKKVNEGINCETCHGLVITNTSIEETHERKYTPGRENLKKKNFCARCHELPDAMTPYSDWLESEAATKGITCQECHMESQESSFRYHGFDSAVRDIGIYSDDLSIKDIELDFPLFRLKIENRIKGHAIPAGGPSRVLVLEILFLDIKEKELYKVVQTFQKKFELIPLVGLLPDKLIENTTIKSGEIRPLNFTLPSYIKGKINKVVFSLRFYEVSDEYQGDIEKAHWISKPILKEEIIL